jgi:hypothetical protein
MLRLIRAEAGEEPKVLRHAEGLTGPGNEKNRRFFDMLRL